jgi:3-oxoadipate enol-lactonase
VSGPVVALGYELTGPADGPVLVLGGSLGTTRQMWQPQLPALSRQLRVLAFDHRGHGGSEVPAGPYRIDDLGRDVLALLDALGIGRFRYAGLSLGGMVGMWLAAHAPDRVERLAVLCTSAYLPPASGWLGRAAQVRAEGTGSVADAVIGRWFTPGFPDAHPDIVDPLRETFTGIPAEGYAGCCEAIAALDLRPALATIGAPTLVIAGADDPATPPAHGQLIADTVPGARIVLLSPAAHLANVQQPDAVTDLLTKHLRPPSPSTHPTSPSI